MNWLLVTVIAQFTAKTTNSEKAISFLPLIPCSINKLKSSMFFTCKNFMFFDFTWKKILFQKMVGGLALPTFPYGPDSCSNLFLKELILSYPILRRFMLFILISFRKDCGSFSSGPFAFVRGKLDDTSSMF